MEPVMKLNRDTGVIERVGGVSYLVKDGVIYDAKALLSDVRDMVTRRERPRRRKTQLPESNLHKACPRRPRTS